MRVLSIEQLHENTSALINEVAKGKSFEIERRGKVIAILEPASNSLPNKWDEILAPVRELHKKAKGKTPNPVLAERARRRR